MRRPQKLQNLRKLRLHLKALLTLRLPAFGLIAIIILASACAMWVRLRIAATQKEQRTYSTDFGQVKPITLDDGTKVDLGPNSSIVVSYSSGERHIEVVRGEAAFLPAHGDAREFSVSAASYRVTDNGTRFSVRIHDNGTVTVLVAEGEILLAPDTTHEFSNSITILEAGDEGVADGRQIAVRHHRPEEVIQRMAWTEGYLDFSGEPLDTVVAEVNRYHRLQIVIVDPSILKVKISAYVRATDSIAFMNALEKTGIVTYKYDPQYRVVRLYRAHQIAQRSSSVVK